jgi:hypothetical protein
LSVTYRYFEVGSMAIALGETPTGVPMQVVAVQVVPVVGVRAPVVVSCAKPTMFGAAAAVSASTTYTNTFGVPPLAHAVLLDMTGVVVHVGADTAIATGFLPTFTLKGVPSDPSELILKTDTPPGPWETGP